MFVDHDLENFADVGDRPVPEALPAVWADEDALLFRMRIQDGLMEGLPPGCHRDLASWLTVEPFFSVDDADQWPRHHKQNLSYE